MDHFLNDVDTARTVEGRAGDRVKHGDGEGLTAGKELSLVDPLIRLIFIQKLDVGLMIEVCVMRICTRLLYRVWVLQRLHSTVSLSFDGLLVDSAGRESGENHCIHQHWPPPGWTGGAGSPGPWDLGSVPAERAGWGRWVGFSTQPR